MTSCRYAYKVDCDPPDSVIMADGVPLKPGVRTYMKSRETLVEACKEGFVSYSGRLRHGGLFGAENLELKLARERYRITFDLTVPGGAFSVDRGAVRCGSPGNRARLGRA
jgi:hypothetical protein